MPEFRGIKAEQARRYDKVSVHHDADAIWVRATDGRYGSSGAAIVDASTARKIAAALLECAEALERMTK